MRVRDNQLSVRPFSLYLLLVSLPLISVPVARAALPGLPGSIAAEVVSARQLPAASYTPVGSWTAAGPAYSHQTGHAATDAAGRRIWEARPGEDKSPAQLLYGPYAEFPAGDYVAFFRIERTGDTDEDIAATLDAAADQGQTILNSSDLGPGDLPRGRYVEAPLPFVHTGGKLELRLFWTGDCSLRVDSVTLFRLAGDNPRTLVRRAPQPTPTGFPSGLVPDREARPFPDLFPRSMPPASDLLVLDIRKQSPGWQLLALSLQGLVNRSRPRLYVLFNDSDTIWLRHMVQRGWVKRTHAAVSPQAAVRQLRSSFHGVVIVDPALPATKNIATMMAGLENALVASPSVERQLRLPVVTDLRGRWRSNVDAYSWAFDHLWPRLNHHVIACYYPGHLALRDYLVENRIFIFWLSGPIDGSRPGADPQAELALMERLLARMPVNIPVMGYPWAGKDVGIGEGPGVTLFAEFGKYLVGSIESSNLSVHSGIRVDRFRQRRVPAPPLRSDRVYVSWIMSDGDNLPVLTVHNFPLLWKDPGRSTLPMGWSISPSSSILIPDVVDYYYSTATPANEFVGAVSGVGYTYPDSYGARFRSPIRSQVFDGFLDQTAAYFDRMDLSDAWIMGITRPDLIRRYAERIPGLDALFPDYGRRVSSYDLATYPTARNVPVFHAVTNWAENLSRDQQISSLVSQIRSITPRERPAFLHLFIWNWGADIPMLQEITRRLGPDYVAVRPDALAHLYREELSHEKVLIRAPSRLTVIASQPVRFRVTLQDVVAAPIGVAWSVTGTAGGQTAPVRVTLRPGVPTAATISAMPSAQQLLFELAGGTSRVLPIPVRRVPMSEILGGGAALAGAASSPLEFVAHYDARDLSHSSGKLIIDPRAAAGEMWGADSKSARQGYVAYGPYADLPAGRYLALFRLKRTGAGTGPTALVDTCVGGGKLITGSKDLDATDLPEGEFRSVPILFTHPGGPVETRVSWSGNAPIAIDGVDLWRISPRH